MSEAQAEVRHRTVMDDEARHVSRVYAEALYRSAEKENQVESVLGELEGVVRDVFDKRRRAWSCSSPRPRSAATARAR